MVGMWTPDYHTPKEFNLKDAFRLIQAKTQSNTTVWGRLGPAKQQDIVKYVSCAEPASLVRSVRLRFGLNEPERVLEVELLRRVVVWSPHADHKG
ncbi:BQ5605_C001g00543 [Microbotryum silenes-dioicae]|uniref:BQ5605_C001g00543 protein n=1 Tax=Microbotryum silenes-dioicae TaxID=796604 RepID=A0A2X0M3N4_9BASI|nr:BQ5605_C001g00543 [Microbotryum silenes-dioicae]